MYTKRQADTASLAMVERLISLATAHLSVTRWAERSAIDPVKAGLACLLLDRAALLARINISALP